LCTVTRVLRPLPPRRLTLFPYTTLFRSQTKGDLPTSFDVEAFEVPGGRDEEWRFVSLRKLRGLHNGSFAEDLKVVPQNIEKKHRSEEHTSELQSRFELVCRLLLEKKTKN